MWLKLMNLTTQEERRSKEVPISYYTGSRISDREQGKGKEGTRTWRVGPNPSSTSQRPAERENGDGASKPSARFLRSSFSAAGGVRLLCLMLHGIGLRCDVSSCGKKANDSESGYFVRRPTIMLGLIEAQ